MMRISSIEPTVLFADVKGKLLQTVNVVIDNQSEPADADLEFRVQSSVTVCRLGRIDHGKRTYQISIPVSRGKPDLRKSVPVKFILKAGGHVRDQLAIAWKPMKHWEIFMTPIAHHDLGYTDTIEGVLRKYCLIYEDVLRFCEETEKWPEESRFRYMVEQAWSIQHFIEQSSKEARAKLKRYIQQGRIEIPALFGNEISGLCSHEELIRLMYPSFRISREFGAKIRSAVITDIPGLSWGLPTVLAGAGIKYFFAGLPTYFQWGRNDIHTFWDEASILRPHGRPDAFYWKGPDERKILVFYQGGYGCWSPRSYQEIMDQLPGMLNQMDEKECPFSVMRYGGYGCGDNEGTDIIVSRIVREWNCKWAYPKLVVATHSMFFERLEKQCKNIRTFSGELPDTDYPVGAISTAWETTLNRVTHDKLHSAEKLAAVSSLLKISGKTSVQSASYPTEDIRNAYDNMLLFDEHTWGKSYNVGTVQNWAWNEKSRYAYKAAGLADTMLAASADKIAGSIALKQEGQYIVVFNSLSFPRTDVVTVPNFSTRYSFDLVDTETGRKAPWQIARIDSSQSPVPHAAGRYARGHHNYQDKPCNLLYNDHHELIDLIFIAENVPSLGYKTFRIVPGDKEYLSDNPKVKNMILSATRIENRFFRVALNPHTGAVESIYDKEHSRELVDKNAPHGVNQLITRWVKSGKTESPMNVKIRKGQQGSVCGSLIISGRGAGCPQLTREIILYNELKKIDFANRVLKDSSPAMEIYFAFPFKMDNPDFRFEGSNSVIKPLRDQFPGSNSNYYSVQHWADVSNGKIGITLSPRDAHLIEFGGLRPCYVSQAHHGVTPPDFGAPFVSAMTSGHMYSFVIDSNFRTNFQTTQQGDMLFRYSITTHNGDWRKGQPKNFGWSAANPLIPVIVNGKQEGLLPESMSFCRLDKPNVLVTAFKRAEDGKGFILRLTEMEGVATKAAVTLPHIKIKRAYQTNLIEKNVKAIPVRGQNVTVSVMAFGISTIRIQGAKD